MNLWFAAENGNEAVVRDQRSTGKYIKGVHTWVNLAARHEYILWGVCMTRGEPHLDFYSIASNQMHTLAVDCNKYVSSFRMSHLPKNGYNAWDHTSLHFPSVLQAAQSWGILVGESISQHEYRIFDFMIQLSNRMSKISNIWGKACLRCESFHTRRTNRQV